MTDNQINSFHRKKQKEEMKHQVITFAAMIIFTLIAFIVVAAGWSKTFVIPLLLILAVIQVAFQFLYFMHMKDKGHELVGTLISAGLFIAAVVALAYTTIIWW